MPLYALGDRRPRIAFDAWIAPSAELIGDVVVGPGASIWFGAVVRADNGPILIGAGTNVQDGAILHSDPDAPLTIGAGCTIGHRAVLHGCTIEDDVLTGMGAIVLNHARIGAGSLIGAAALVTEGKVFPERSLLMGAPAKLVRTLDPGRSAGGDVYVEKARCYAADLSAVTDDRAG